MTFNFDEWALLAKHDRLAFEQKRAATLQQYITSRAKTESDLRRLNGLQFRIDMLRRKHTTPLAACIEISKLLMAHVYQLGHPDDVLFKEQEHPTDSCTVVHFPEAKK